MAQQVMKTRITQKHDTQQNWDNVPSFVPMAGEIIIYDDINKFKIGDGKTTISNLSFFESQINWGKIGDLI